MRQWCGRGLCTELCSKVWLHLLSISWFSLLYSYVLPKRNTFSFVAEGCFSLKMRNILRFETLKKKKKRSSRKEFCSIFFLSVLEFYHLLSLFLKLWLLAIFPAAVFRNIWSPERTSLQVQKELGAMAALAESVWEMENKGLSLWNNLSGRNDKLRLSESIW